MNFMKLKKTSKAISAAALHPSHLDELNVKDDLFEKFLDVFSSWLHKRGFAGLAFISTQLTNVDNLVSLAKVSTMAF